MEEYLRGCKRMEGMSATMIEFSGGEGALKTAMAAVDVSTTTTFISSNKRKKSVGVFKLGDPNVNCSGNSVFPADSARSDRARSVRPMSRDVIVKDIRRSSDLQQGEDFETVYSADVLDSFSGVRGETVGIMESSSTEKKGSTEAIHRRREKKPAGSKPPEAEIEEFFADAEKYEQKKFLEKYNYDVVKDAPLEGRYQWVRLNRP